MTDDVLSNGECATGRWLRAMADIEHDDAMEQDDGWQVLADNEREFNDGNE